VASTTQAHDPFGQVTAMRRRLEADRWLSTTTGYDAAGNTTSVAQPQGAITDRATGSVVLGPRLYDPSTARFSTADSFVAGGLDLGLALDPLTGNRYLFAGANPVAFYDDGHSPYVRPVPGHPVGEREPALELLRRVRERQERSQPMSFAAARRPPTKDGFCGGDILTLRRQQQVHRLYPGQRQRQGGHRLQLQQPIPQWQSGRCREHSRILR
jgi:RHS repeat-associated protein